MDMIELERWKPSEADPRKLEYAGQPAAQEVFEELKHRLESMGYLPDEYFLLDSHWENGREIPRDADIFCTTDYGSSEGVYLDVYLKWYDEERQKRVMRLPLLQCRRKRQPPEVEHPTLRPDAPDGSHLPLWLSALMKGRSRLWDTLRRSISPT